MQPIWASVASSLGLLAVVATGVAQGTAAPADLTGNRDERICLDPDVRYGPEGAVSRAGGLRFSRVTRRSAGTAEESGCVVRRGRR